MDDRIERLETRFMAAEDLLDELNRRAWRQQQEIDALRQIVQRLEGQLRSAHTGAQTSRPEDEIPPHW